MITRDYQAPELGVRDTRSVQGTDIVRAPMDARGPIETGDSQWRTRLFEQIGNNAGQTLQKMGDLAYSNAYLEGQAKAGVIASEEELQGDPMTKDWQIAGYRDSMSKLALADSEAQFNVDLADLRTKDTPEFQTYLKERRTKLMPALSGASREARAAMAGQMLMQDRAATKSWTTERKKYIIEQRTQATHTLANTQFKSVQALQNKIATGDADQSDLEPAMQNLGASLFASVWNDPAYTSEHKKEMTFNLVNQALAQDIVPLYDYLNKTTMPDSSGSETTLLSRLTGEQQTKLSNAYVSAMQATADKRNFARRAELAKDRALIDAGMYTGTYEEYKTKLHEAVYNGIIKGDAAESSINNFLDKQLKFGKESTGAQMLIRGDINGLANAGMTIEQGVTAVESTMARNKVPADVRLQTWLDVGLHSHDVGFKKAGEILSASLRNMKQPDGTVLPQHKKVFEDINTKLRQAEGAGYEIARSTLLSGLGENDRVFAERILRSVDSGVGYDVAIDNAKRAEERENALSPAQRAALGADTFRDASKLVQAEGAQGLLQRWFSSARALLPGNGGVVANANKTIRPESTISFRDGVMSDSKVVKLYEQGMRDSLMSELGNVTLMSPGLDAESAVRVAKANLAARTITTDNGPIYLPRNANAAQIFGVGQGNVAAVGKAIDGLLPPSKENSRWHIQFTDGRVLAQEYNGDTPIGNAKPITPDIVRAKVQEQMKSEQDYASKVYGKGRDVQVQDGGGVISYSGENKSGVPQEWMFGYRSNLVDHEGVKRVPYPDLSKRVDKKGNPIMTVGVGVSSHNEFYPKPQADGTVSVGELRSSFLNASDAAAAAGANAAKSVSRWNEPGFKLMAELAYQSGTGFMSPKNGATGATYRAFADTLRGQDVEAAKAAFKNTAAWYYSRDPNKPDVLTKRQKSYLNLIEQTMKG